MQQVTERKIQLTETPFTNPWVKKMLSEEDVFWNLFCRILCENSDWKVEPTPSGNYTDLFQKIKQTEKESYLKSIVEKIRELFLDFFENPKEISLVKSEGLNNPIDCYSIVQSNNPGGKRNQLFSVPFDPGYIVKFMFPLIAKSIGVAWKKNACQKDTFDLVWNNFFYPIPPKAVKCTRPEDKEYYGLYKEQILCDFTIKTKQDSIGIHSTQLYLYGEEFFKKITTTKFKESIEKNLDLSEYPLPVVKAFIDFIYLGKEHLEPEAFFKSDVDLLELLNLAHTYHIEPLINICTNLLSLSASSLLAEDVKELAAIYHNEHLEQLASYIEENTQA